jgi:outer membrane translocation and assembly module TamA
VFAVRLLGGSATGGGRVPLSEQFFLGGYELLRGYDLYSIRGDRMLLASAEARIPLSAGVQGALFADAGNAWAPGARASLSDLRAGVGIGLRFLTPIGPLRLDAAYGNELKTYVSLGQAY